MKFTDTLDHFSDTLDHFSDTLDHFSDTLDHFSDTLDYSTDTLDYFTDTLELFDGYFRVIRCFSQLPHISRNPAVVHHQFTAVYGILVIVLVPLR
jgi:hypothetical protein